MSLVRYEPIDVLNRFNERFTNLFGNALPALTDEDSNVVTSSWMPPVDIKEEQDRFLIKADVPGVDSKDIDVTMERGMLTIKGTRSSEVEEERENYKRVERSQGSFYRRFGLPDSADGENISAKCADGVLEITIPKHEVEKARKIKVNR